jgi:hypothetical protein
MITCMIPTGKNGLGLVSIHCTVLYHQLTNVCHTVASLCKKYQRAKAAIGAINLAATELGSSINNKDWILQWEELENLARTERGEALMIYNVAPTPGKCWFSVYHTLLMKATRVFSTCRAECSSKYGKE